jgi:signal transduction histidine kinase
MKEYSGQFAVDALEPVDRALQSAFHLRTLVNDLLDIARIYRAEMSLQLELVEPRKLLEETCRQ